MREGDNPFSINYLQEDNPFLPDPRSTPTLTSQGQNSKKRSRSPDNFFENHKKPATILAIFKNSLERILTDIDSDNAAAKLLEYLENYLNDIKSNTSIYKTFKESAILNYANLPASLQRVIFNFLCDNQNNPNIVDSTDHIFSLYSNLTEESRHIIIETCNSRSQQNDTLQQKLALAMSLITLTSNNSLWLNLRPNSNSQ